MHQSRPAQRCPRLPALVLLCLSATGPCLAQEGQGPSGATDTGASVQPTGKRAVLSEADRSVARALADDAFNALDAGQNERAEQLFSQALQRADVPTLRVGRADARVQLNRWVEAQEDYQAAVAFPLLATDPAPFRESQVAAASQLEQLKIRMPRLVLCSDDAEATFTIDGGALQSVNGKTELSINPGPHRVQVAAWGRSEIHEFEAMEGKPTELEATTPHPPPSAVPSESTTVARKARTPSPSTPLSAIHTDDAPVAQDASLSGRVLVTGAITGALAIGAAVTGIVFWSERADSEDEGLPYVQRDNSYKTALTMQWVSSGLTVAAVVGAGLTTYFWLSPAPEHQQAAGAAQPRVVGALPLARGLLIGTGGRF